MKIRALAVNNVTKEEKSVTAFEAIYLRNSSIEKYKNYTYFYIENGAKYELIAKYIKETKTAFFAFKSSDRPQYVAEDTGESLAHFVTKNALARLKTLKLIDISNNKEYMLNTFASQNEKLFNLQNLYYADVWFALDKNQSKSMKKYFYKWNQQLVVEILVTHSVSKEKAQDFYNSNIPIFQVKIPETTRGKIEKECIKELSKENIDLAINNAVKMFQKGIRGVFISNPETQEYKIMMKYKEEIENFRLAKEEMEKEYFDAKNKLAEIQNSVREQEEKKQYYDSLEAEVRELRKSLAEVKAHPIKNLFKK